ncbi:hypothetical protein N0B31_17300 [Salinirubellus salinus]|uniref:Uncharacterized protein n=1 Tax=Salinirubellus salinus TaxID=1364945 RepID=A0A9E7R1A0_9EURY|nr:hypothetical protein [Salinirubellus salinus]UWM53871.1 hypothetical protein N0B31_17300 [Salinirubellus salinus]
MSRLHPELLPTTAVLLTVAFVTLALTTPPDPYTQVLYGGPALLVAGGLAALLTHGGGFDRLGWSPAGKDHGWTVAVFLGVTVVVGVFVPDATSPAVTGIGPLAGFLLGAWLGWGDGRSRLSRAESAA